MNAPFQVGFGLFHHLLPPFIFFAFYGNVHASEKAPEQWYVGQFGLTHVVHFIADERQAHDNIERRGVIGNKYPRSVKMAQIAIAPYPPATASKHLPAAPASPAVNAGMVSRPLDAVKHVGVN